MAIQRALGGGQRRKGRRGATRERRERFAVQRSELHGREEAEWPDRGDEVCVRAARSHRVDRVDAVAPREQHPRRVADIRSRPSFAAYRRDDVCELLLCEHRARDPRRYGTIDILCDVDARRRDGMLP